jgi:aminoglycoside phosphotransferase (APT) family kinase protein
LRDPAFWRLLKRIFSTDFGIVNLEGKQLLASGWTSDVYTWDEGRVLKLHGEWMPAFLADWEWKNSRAVHAMGLSAPAVFEQVEVAGRRGIIFERLDGVSLFRHVESRPWLIFGAARQLADLHAKIHQHTAPSEMRSRHEQIAQFIESKAHFSDAQRLEIRDNLERLPKGAALCHGDFHPANIVLTARGPVIIDWSSASRSHPMTDVAQTSYLFRHASLPPGTAWHARVLLIFSRHLLHTTYLDRYLRLHPGTRAEIEAWQPTLRASSGTWQKYLADQRATTRSGKPPCASAQNTAS